MNRGIPFHVDFGLLAPVLILVVFSLITLFSINTALFQNQLFFLIISLFFYLFFSNINFKLLRNYALPIYIGSLIILTIVLFIGTESRGATRWVEIFGFQIQFSEILKPFLIVAFASFVSNQQMSLKTLLLTILLLFPICFLIYKQPDLGNALIYAIVVIFLLLTSGFSLRWFILGFIGFVALSPFVWQFLHGYQKQRVLTFLYPSLDPLGKSYNAIQSVIAVGSGMFFGKGIGQGTQSGLRFLPERHTDFIFATFAEEFGFLGSFILILTFIWLLYRIFLIFEDTNDKFSKIFAAGGFFLILTQSFINIGMNIEILPIVGVTLPFVSSGGSSILSNFILLGFLSSINKDAKKRNTLEIK